MALKENMRAGIEAAGKARKKIPKSANYAYTSSPIRIGDKNYYKAETLPQNLAENSELGKMRGTIQAARGDKSMWEFLRKAAKIAASKGIGNCGEVSAVAIDELYKAHKGKILEYVDVCAGSTRNAVIPHVIVVIGRQGGTATPESDMGFPDSWGPNAVICDAWDRNVYPANQYKNWWDGLKKHAFGEELSWVLRCRAPTS